jgi:hypothetical protein
MADTELKFYIKCLELRCKGISSKPPMFSSREFNYPIIEILLPQNPESRGFFGVKSDISLKEDFTRRDAY